MSQTISPQLALIHNLANAAKDHKEHCDHNCNVSLGQLKDAAKELMHGLKLDTEVLAAADIIKDMPWM